MRVLSHESAAVPWAFPVLRPRPGPHVTVPPGGNAAIKGFMVHRSHLAADDVVDLNGVLVTSQRRTAIDLARILPLSEAVVIFDVLRSRRLADVPTVRGPGSLTVRRAAELSVPDSGSPFESLVRVALLQAGFGPVSTQYRLDVDGHAYDLALPWAGVVIECDSWEHHSGRPAFVADRHHGNVAAAEGWTVVRLVWRDVWPSPERAIALVRAAVLAGRGRRVRVRRTRARDTPLRVLET
jgi:very-short-patch-repair endonuclease